VCWQLNCTGIPVYYGQCLGFTVAVSLAQFTICSPSMHYNRDYFSSLKTITVLLLDPFDPSKIDNYAEVSRSWYGQVGYQMESV